MAGQSYEDIRLTAEKELAAIINSSQMDSNVDIDKTLNDKAKKNQLTKPNVKNIIKNVLMNDDVATMLRQTLDDDVDGNCLYEPKLTRAKIREMLKTYPPSAHQWSQNQQQQSTISECRLLIEKEFPDDEEDEEYHPDKTLEEDDEDDYDDESKCTEINKSLEIEGETENETDVGENKIITDETIGMRTRSKFPLNDTPLEIIEQAFIPPDITEDMYDSACENDEWMEFLSGFKKPLECAQNDDTEDDPEYNVLCDDDFSNVDKEEFRIDKSVRITRKEFNDLMNELYEFTESCLESDETNNVIIENYNDKSDVQLKNSTQSIPVSTSNNFDCSAITSTNDKNAGKSKGIIPFHTSNKSNCKLKPKHSTNQKNVKNPTSIIQDTPVHTISCSEMKSISENYVQITEVDCNSTQLKRQLDFPRFNVESINRQNEKFTSPVAVLNFNSDIKKCKNNTSNEITAIRNSGSTVYSQYDVGFTPKQIILLKAQLTKHVQLATQSYLLSAMSKKFTMYRRKLKIMLEKVESISSNKIYVPINIKPSLAFISDWGEVIEDEPYIERDSILLPSIVKEFMFYYEKPVFVFPELLPSTTFCHKFKKTFPMKPAEEKLLVFKIDSVYKMLKNSPSSRKKNLFDLYPTIIKTVHRRWFSHRRLPDLKSLVTKRQREIATNVIKSYFKRGIIEDTIHIVDIAALFYEKSLFECNVKKFPRSWGPFIKKEQLTCM